MANRNRELVLDNWSLVTERVLTTGFCSEGWYSEHSGVCRRAELPGRSVKVTAPSGFNKCVSVVEVRRLLRKQRHIDVQ